MFNFSRKRDRIYRQISNKYQNLTVQIGNSMSIFLFKASGFWCILPIRPDQNHLDFFRNPIKKVFSNLNRSGRKINWGRANRQSGNRNGYLSFLKSIKMLAFHFGCLRHFACCFRWIQIWVKSAYLFQPEISRIKKPSSDPAG